jgi:hypothetical protein
MKILTISIWAWILIVFAGQVGAMPVIGYAPMVPAYIEAISNLDSLSNLLKSANFNDKLAIYIRIGEIGDTRGLKILMDAFEDQPYDNAIEATPGIKYYCLESIGKIGGPDAEKFLKEIVSNLKKDIRAGTNSFTRADSLITIDAALNSLGEIGTFSASVYLDSIFHNNDNFWLIRANAYLGLLNIEMKNRDLNNMADTAMFLIENWKEIPLSQHQFTGPGVIDTNYIKRDNIEALIYKYRSFMTPYITDLMNKMNSSDPKFEILKELKNRIEANPSH